MKKPRPLKQILEERRAASPTLFDDVEEPYELDEDEIEIALPPMGAIELSPFEKVLTDMQRLMLQRSIESDEELEALLDEVAEADNRPDLLLAPGTVLSAREQAQEVMYEAFPEDGPKAVEMAHRALEIYPDCADAYVLLADEASDKREALELFRKGMECGERNIKSAFGEDIFQAADIDFWSSMEARSYLRARFGLASELWDMEEHEVAVDHWQAILRLNPDDNMGCRYLLQCALLQLERHRELELILQRYQEPDRAVWAYSRALWKFRTGKRAKANKALAEAFGSNLFVPVYLLMLEEFPRERPEVILSGGPEEAVDYIGHALKAWIADINAMKWLAEQFAPLLQGLAEAESSFEE